MTTYIQTKLSPVKNRVEYVDMAKGIGMFAIIWGHIMLSGWSNNLVYSFHIPLFFFLSGMMFSSSKYPSFGVFIKRRIKTLLVPYVMFSLITWILWVVMNLITHSNVELWKPLLQTFIAQGSGGFMVHNVPLWFVTCLFVVEVLYFYIEKLPKWLNIVICVVCALIGDYMIRGGHLSFYRLLPWNIEAAMSALLFYSLGNLLIRKYSHQKLVDLIRNHILIIILAISILTIILFFSANWNGHITLGSNSLGRNTIVFYVNAIIGIFTTLSFSILLTLKTLKNRILYSLMKYLKWFGQNSFFVMASHVPVKGLLILCVSLLFQATPTEISNSINMSLIVFILTIIGDSVLVLLIILLKKHDETIAYRCKKRKQINVNK